MDLQKVLSQSTRVRCPRLRDVSVVAVGATALAAASSAADELLRS